MTFKAIYSEEALSQLRKLDNQAAGRILDKVDSTSQNPSHFFERLSGREDCKLRVGDYRVIAKIIHEEKTIFIISIGHRKNVYEKK